jgi:hypothetical protein
MRPLVRRSAGICALALGLAAPAALGVTIVHVAGFYPGTALETAMQAGGLALASLPGLGVLASRR